MIDKNKTYRTRDGREVRIYATDHGGRFPVAGAFFDDGRWQFSTWDNDGNWCSGACSADLIEVKPRIVRTYWMLVYDTYCTHSKEKPAKFSSDCKACVKVEIECEEGEGL